MASAPAVTSGRFIFGRGSAKEPDSKRMKSDGSFTTRRAQSGAVQPPKEDSAQAAILVPSAQAEVLVQLVLRKAGPHIEKAASLLRERVASGRKVHGQTFSLSDVEEAIACFGQSRHEEQQSRNLGVCAAEAQEEVRGRRAQPPERPKAEACSASPARKEEPALKPFRSAVQPLAFQGSYMAPSAVSRLVGDEVCAICLEPLRAQAQTIAMCGHIFHRACLNEAKSTSCPKCRRPVDMDRERLQDLKRLILSTRRTFDEGQAGYLRCNLLELSREELLSSCNARRCRGETLHSMHELGQALSELAEESRESLLVERDCVTILL